MVSYCLFLVNLFVLRLTYKLVRIGLVLEPLPLLGNHRVGEELALVRGLSFEGNSSSNVFGRLYHLRVLHFVGTGVGIGLPLEGSLVAALHNIRVVAGLHRRWPLLPPAVSLHGMRLVEGIVGCFTFHLEPLGLPPRTVVSPYVSLHIPQVQIAHTHLELYLSWFMDLERVSIEL